MRIEFILDDKNLNLSIIEIINNLDSLNEIIGAIKINMKKTEIKGYTVEKRGNDASIMYSDRRHLYLGISALFSQLDIENFSESKKLEVPKIGHMIDCARNAVFTLSYFKKYICNIALLGSSFLEIYLEDCFEVEGEEYFGYLRGRYTKQEIKEIDEYCQLFGIELIPSVQTLAHYNQLFIWNKYEDIHDTADILLCDEEKTYIFLDKIIKAITEMFSSKTINIGMDEASMLGLGKHLARFGYEKNYSILTRHLKRVLEICFKYNLKPRMWADMFYRFAFGQYYSPESNFTAEQISAIPEGVELVYWNYDMTKKSEYTRYFEQQASLNKPFIFAGCSWNWLGFVPFNKFSEVRLLPAIEVCKEFSAPYMLTSWGGNGNECSHFSMLSTYVISSQKCLCNEIDMEKTSRICKLLSGYSYDELIMLDIPNKVYKSEVINFKNPSKFLFYNDVLLSQSDLHINLDYAIYYKSHAKKLKELSTRNSKYSYIFDLEYKLCHFLELKSVISAQVKSAYDKGDLGELDRLANKVLPTMIKRANLFYSAFTAMWDKEAKPNGMEVHDLRIGGSIARLKRVKDRINDYLTGKIEKLTELNRKNLLRLSGFSDIIEDNKCYLCEDFITNYTVGVLKSL